MHGFLTLSEGTLYDKAFSHIMWFGMCVFYVHLL